MLKQNYNVEMLSEKVHFVDAKISATFAPMIKEHFAN